VTRWARAWRAVDALPDERRQALVLRFVDEMSAREIGAVMGRSEGVHPGAHPPGTADRCRRAVQGPIVTSGRIPEDEEAAIVLDVYLDELLAGRPGGPTQVRPEGASGVDPELATAAQAMGLALARFHPSFRFEERLAARLRAAGTGPDVEVTAGGPRGVCSSRSRPRSRHSVHGPGA